MTFSEYFEVLDLQSGASIDDIKRAYRQKARMYHPDINHTPGAKDLFIQATEAYEFLIANFEAITSDEAAFRQSMEEWRKYRQDRSKMRANAYARASYARFKKSQFYKTTRILDGTTIIFSLIVSIIIILCTVIGYFYRLSHPIPDIENPSVPIFILLLSMGVFFFIVSLAYLNSYIKSSKKHRRKSS